MPWSITIANVAGTAVRIHITFLLFLLWIGVSAFSHGGADAAWNNIAFMLALFACVLLHEFGHIFTARAFGIKTPTVTLLPIGGVASLERIPENPKQALAVALAGPAVNFVIALVLIVATGAVMPDGIEKVDNPNVGLASRLVGANLFLALFNLIPAFPMDGGRVLHAVLAMRLGPQRAIQIAARVGQGFAYLLGFLGLFGNPLLIFIAIFVYVAAAGEAQESIFRDAVRGLSVGDGMETRFARLAPDATIASAVDLLLATPQHELPVVDAFGKLIGILTREELMAALQDKPRETPVLEIMRAPAKTLRNGDDLEPALRELGAGGAAVIGVVDVEGKLVGMLTRENLAEMMMIKAAQPEWIFKRSGT